MRYWCHQIPSSNFSQRKPDLLPLSDMISIFSPLGKWVEGAVGQSFSLPSSTTEILIWTAVGAVYQLKLKGAQFVMHVRA